MPKFDLQLGGAYAYQWQCGILLALNCFLEAPTPDDTLFDLVNSFLGQVESIHLEGEDRKRGVALEDVNLLGAGRRILIQVKTKEREGQWWTPSDPLLRKALYRFYDSHFLEDDAENTRFVFLTNRPFNPALAEINAAVEAGALDQCADVGKLYQSLAAYAKAEKKDPIDRERFDAMLVRTRLVEYLKVNRAKASVRLMLRAYGLQDVDKGYALLYEHFSEQSILKGGGIITVESVIDVLGSPVEGRLPLRAPGPKPQCPYPGMEPFGELDKDRFFGRRQKAAQLLRQLRSHPFLAIVGPSGSGKSSLVYAGLVPELRESSLFGPGGWRVISLRPGPTPMEQLANRIGSHLADPGLAVSHLLAGKPDAGRVLLVVDQFEELFTLAREQEVVPFQQTLLRLAEHSDCYVVLTVRADFYPHLMVPPLWDEIKDCRAEVLPLDEQGLRLAIARPAEKAGVFVQPALVERLIADAAGEPGILPFVQETLVLLWDRMDGRALSLSAYDELVASTEVYEGTGGKPTTGLQIAMAEHAENTLRGLTPEQQAIARRIFLRLVQFGEGRTDIRRQQTVSELQSSDDDKALFDRTLARLIESRLLTASGEAEGGARRVDIAHEALITGWPRLRKEWLGQRRAAEQTRRRLEGKAAEWVRAEKRGGLLDEYELQEALDWLDSPDSEELGGASTTVLALVTESELDIKRKADQKQREARFRMVAAGAIAFLVIAALAIGLWFSLRMTEQERQAAVTQGALATVRSQQAQDLEAAATTDALRLIDLGTSQAQTEIRRQEADNARATAEVRRIEAENLSQIALARQLAAQSNSLLEQNLGTELPLLLALEAFRSTQDAGLPPVSEADDSLRRALAAAPVRHLRHGDNVEAVAFSPDGMLLATAGSGGTTRVWDTVTGKDLLVLLHEDTVWAVTFSPDGTLLATASVDGTACLWDTTTGQELAVLRHEDWVNTVAFSPDSTRLATAGRDGTARLWDTDTGEELRVLHHEGWIRTVTYSPDGTRLATASDDGTARLWDAATGQELAVLHHDAGVSAVAFSPDGARLTTASQDTTARLWDTATGQELGVLQHDAQVNAIAFSPDGRRLATASYHGTASLWDMVAEQRIAVLRHGDPVNDIGFSPDGTRLATASNDRTARLWDGISGEELAILRHEHWVNAVAFSPDGTRLATGSLDNTVGLWNTAAGQESPTFRHDYRIESVALSPNGMQLATASGDMTACLWDAATGEQQGILRHADSVNAVVFSPDWTLLATASDDDTARLWDTATGEELAILPHDAAVKAVAFSPDGTLLATATYGGTAHIWDTDMAQELVIIGHEYPVNDIAFSPDGTLLATASWDAARLWDVVGGEELAVLPNEEGVSAVAFSPDGTLLATASGTTAYLWETATGEELAILRHGAKVNAVAFSPNGVRLATASNDATARLWDVADGEELTILRHDAGFLAVAFSPDGMQLATGSADGTARLWRVNVEEFAGSVCERVSRNLTSDEWRQYLGDREYRPTCPGLPMPGVTPVP